MSEENKDTQVVQEETKVSDETNTQTEVQESTSSNNTTNNDMWDGALLPIGAGVFLLWALFKILF